MMRKIKRYLWITFFIILLSPVLAQSYGGGGVYNPPAAPETTLSSLVINNGAQSTTSNIVDLALSATNAQYIAISNTSDFLNVSWENYTASKKWTLTTGSGDKTVYVKFKSSSGGITSVIQKTIKLETVTLVNQPDINNDSKVNDFDFSLLMSNWGTPSNAAADLNGDGKVDDFDFSLLMSNWTG